MSRKLDKAIKDHEELIAQRGKIKADLEAATVALAGKEAGLGDDLLAGGDIKTMADELGRLTTQKAALSQALQLADRKAAMAEKVRHELEKQDAVDRAKGRLADAVKEIDEALKLVDRLEKHQQAIRAAWQDIDGYASPHRGRYPENDHWLLHPEVRALQGVENTLVKVNAAVRRADKRNITQFR